MTTLLSKLPATMLRHRVADLSRGESGFISASSLWVEPDGTVYVEKVSIPESTASGHRIFRIARAPASHPDSLRLSMPAQTVLRIDGVLPEDRIDRWAKVTEIDLVPEPEKTPDEE